MKGGRFFNPRVASHHFRSMSAYHNPPASTLSFSQFLANQSDPGPKVCNSDPTIEIMIKYCKQTNWLKLAFSCLGRILKDGHRAEAVIFNPILKGLCSANRVGEAATIVMYKMPKLGCIPDLETYNTLIDGLCKKVRLRRQRKCWIA